MDNKNFNGIVSFTAQPLNDTSLEELSVMTELLKKVGVSLEMIPRESMDFK